MGSFIELNINTQAGDRADTTSPTVRIELPMDTPFLEDVIENLIKPALLASGYYPKTVDEYFYPIKEDSKDEQV